MSQGREVLTNATQRIEEVRNGSQRKRGVISAQGTLEVSGQPLHDDVVGPVHREVGNVDGPQSAVANKIQPPYLRTHER